MQLQQPACFLILSAFLVRPVNYSMTLCVPLCALLLPHYFVHFVLQVGASIELSESEDLDALYDRFLLDACTIRTGTEIAKTTLLIIFVLIFCTLVSHACIAGWRIK